MNPPKKRREFPEKKIERDIIDFLRAREWFVKNMHGNAMQQGIPDLYATHATYGARWIEVKYAKKYRFTAAQIRYFPQFAANGAGIWILTAATESEYRKLWADPNWQFFMSTMK